MRLLQRSRRGPRAKTIRPAERYLLAGTDEARRLGHNYVGTEHMLAVLVRNSAGFASSARRARAPSSWRTCSDSPTAITPRSGSSGSCRCSAGLATTLIIVSCSPPTTGPLSGGSGSSSSGRGTLSRSRCRVSQPLARSPGPVSDEI